MLKLRARSEADRRVRDLALLQLEYAGDAISGVSLSQPAVASLIASGARSARTVIQAVSRIGRPGYCVGHRVHDSRMPHIAAASVGR